MEYPLNNKWQDDFPDKDYWNGLEVHFNKINEQWDNRYQLKLKGSLLSMNLAQLKELCEISGIKIVDKKEEIIKEILSNQSISRLIYFFKEFQNKKKRAIEQIYEWFYSDAEKRYDLSLINKLYHLYSEDKSYLFDVLTIYKWEIKSSGNKYIYTKGLKEKDLIQIGTDEKVIKTITDTLHNNSKNHNYKVVSTAFNKESGLMVVLIYKEIANIMLPDFDGNKSNKKVSELLFEIDLRDKSISIKCNSITDENSLVDYLNKNMKTDLQKYKMKSFTEFSREKFDLLLSNSEMSADSGYRAFISSISFYSSSLWKSPSITLDLKDDDVWPAVVEANKAGIIKPSSLKDIRYVKLSFSDLTSRRIYSRVETNGDVTFRLQDANLTKKQIVETKEIFKDLLGLPLNQPISNKSFTVGTADKVDFILKSCNPNDIGSSQDLFDELLSNEFIIMKHISGFCCSNEDCNTFYEELPESECEECGAEKYKQINNIKYDLNIEKVKIYTKSRISNWLKDKEYKMLNPTTLTVYGKKYELLNFENKYEITTQILITNELIPGRTLKRLRRLLTPTMIIYVGYQEFDFINHNSDSIYPLNFGQIFSYDNTELFKNMDNIIEIIESRAKTIVAQASSTAYESLNNLIDKDLSKDYSDREFEDDVFAIIKDIFPNADKWGREMSGERVPEGLFSLQYNTRIGTKQDEYKRLYSFDCKLTSKDKGYDLGISEKRKAWDYIDELHNVREITKYSDRNEVSGHIFISNKYKDSQISGMRSFFNEKMSGKTSTIPIFIEVRQLLLIHKLYRKSYEEISLRKNTFYEEINKLLMQEDGIVLEQDINDCFEEVLAQDPDFRFIDMKRVKKKLKKGGKVGKF